MVLCTCIPELQGQACLLASATRVSIVQLDSLGDEVRSNSCDVGLREPSGASEVSIS